MKNIYIAGRMTGYPQFNFPQFDYWRDRFTKRGWNVFSPADNDRKLLGKPRDWLPTDEDHDGTWSKWTIPNAPTYREMLKADLNWIATEADAIFMMHDWEHGSGAVAEFHLARTLKLDIRYEDTI